MDLDVSQVILRPVVSDKAYKLNKKHKKLVLFVHPKADKRMVANALKVIFNIVVRSINIIVNKGKKYRLRGNLTRTAALKKKAIVTLAEGYSLDIFGHEGFEADTRGSGKVNNADSQLQSDSKE